MITAKSLTTEEKLKLLTGKNMWQTEDLDGKINCIFFADGPHGLRKMKKNSHGYYENIPSTAYPNLVNIANTWNVSCAYETGKLIAEDCVENGVDVLLAPGVNIKRTPLCGRNFEYFSEDPYLSGILAKNFTDGVQKYGVGACLKHFCVNNREIGRYFQSSEVDERTMHEIYLTAFEIALKANPVAVMCSYNPVNGVYASENKKLLTDILRGEFSYQGLIISDWASVKNGGKSLAAGLDLRMPYTETAYDELKDAYDKGVITDKEINNAVNKILETVSKLQIMRGKSKITKDALGRKNAALPIAEESIVLLKNDGVLPLGKNSACVIGELNSKPYLGGGGAAEVTSTSPQRPLNELIGEILGINVSCSVKVKLDSLDPCHNDREGILLASENDVSIVLVGNCPSTEIEGHDRETLRLSNKEERLIKDVAATGSKTVVVIEAGSAIDMTPWINDVAAVVFAGYLGDNANKAIANILTGKAIPSGKLSETFPLSVENTYCKTDTGRGGVEVYRDGLLVGYRYYDTENVPVLFPFGFGLSYAKFEYSDIAVERRGETDFAVSYTVANISDTSGKEISQVYVKDAVSSVFKPNKELKAFSKDFIKAGESKRITVTLDKNAFAHYDVISGGKYIENGEFIIMVGASCMDIKLKQKVSIALPPETQYSVI